MILVVFGKTSVKGRPSGLSFFIMIDLTKKRLERYDIEAACEFLFAEWDHLTVRPAREGIKICCGDAEILMTSATPVLLWSRLMWLRQQGEAMGDQVFLKSLMRKALRGGKQLVKRHHA